MNVKLVLQFIVAALCFTNIYLYISKRSLYCSQKEAKCIAQNEVFKGRLIVGILSLLFLAAIIALEVYFK